MTPRDRLGRDVGPDVTVQFSSLRGKVVRSLALGDETAPTTPLVVVVPGLGLPFYTLPTARAVVARGLACTVLDVPGFGSSLPRATRPTIHAGGMTAARWVEALAGDRPVVVLGHSTGGQAALTAALALSARRRGFSLVLAGTTFAPEQRRLAMLARATPFAYRDDRPDQIDLMEVYRGRTGILAMIQSGLHDAPERRIADLPVPVTVTAGVHDAFVPVTWLDQLAGSASSAPSVRTSLIGGSHNNLFTHPDDVADLVVLAANDAVSAMTAAPTPAPQG